jgi:hypothetical protein
MHPGTRGTARDPMDGSMNDGFTGSASPSQAVDGFLTRFLFHPRECSAGPSIGLASRGS